MKWVYPEIDYVVDTDNERVNTIVIENQKLFFSICDDLYNQVQGNEGKSVVSSDNKVLEVSKNVEVLNQFIPFDVNTKVLLNRLSSTIEKKALENDYYEKTMQEMANLQKYLFDLTEYLPGDIVLKKMSISSIIKASGVEFENEYDKLAEKVLDYMEMVREYDKDKLFILINFRSYVMDEDVYQFMDTIKRQLFNVVLIEEKEHKLLSNEKRYLIDEDLCEIAIN